MTAEKKSLLQLAIVLLIWASSFSITRSVVKDIPPGLFAFLRYSVASVVILIIYYIRRRKIVKPATGMHGQVLMMALTGVTLYNLFFNISLVHTSASVGALIQGFIPVVVMLLAAIFLKEKLSGWQVIGGLLCLAGVVIIGFIAPGKAEEDNAWGSVLMIAAVICWAVYTILSKKVANTDALWLTTRLTVLGTILLLPAVVIELRGQPFPQLSGAGWGAIAYMGIFPSALSYLWYNNALKHLTASKVGLLLNFDPAFGAIIAILFLKEPLAVFQIAGGVLVFAGILISTAGEKKGRPQNHS